MKFSIIEKRFNGTLEITSENQKYKLSDENKEIDIPVKSDNEIEVTYLPPKFDKIKTKNPILRFLAYALLGLVGLVFSAIMCLIFAYNEGIETHHILLNCDPFVIKKRFKVCKDTVFQIEKPEYDKFDQKYRDSDILADGSIPLETKIFYRGEEAKADGRMNFFLSYSALYILCLGLNILTAYWIVSVLTQAWLFIVLACLCQAVMLFFAFLLIRFAKNTFKLLNSVHTNLKENYPLFERSKTE